MIPEIAEEQQSHILEHGHSRFKWPTILGDLKFGLEGSQREALHLFWEQLADVKADQAHL